MREKIYYTDLAEDIFNLWKNCLQTHEQLWLEIAEKVTMCVQQIIEFAKMVPGFMSLLQDDQIMLLKGKIVGSTFRVKFLQKSLFYGHYLVFMFCGPGKRSLYREHIL